jgi:hypothetical protein
MARASSRAIPFVLELDDGHDGGAALDLSAHPDLARELAHPAQALRLHTDLEPLARHHGGTEAGRLDAHEEAVVAARVEVTGEVGQHHRGLGHGLHLHHARDDGVAGKVPLQDRIAHRDELDRDDARPTLRGLVPRLHAVDEQERKAVGQDVLDLNGVEHGAGGRG